MTAHDEMQYCRSSGFTSNMSKKIAKENSINLVPDLQIHGDVNDRCADHLTRQSIIADAKHWHEKGQDDEFVFEILRSAFPDESDWDEKMLMGMPGTLFVRRTNDSIHCTEKTRGQLSFGRRLLLSKAVSSACSVVLYQI